jgi:glutamate:GABA antiporter
LNDKLATDKPAALPTDHLLAAEAQVQAHSAALHKDLGLADLVLAQILVVMVPEFFGTAVKAGAAHVVLWVCAIVLFFIPQGLVVAYLNRLMPLEGGLYEWARLAFGDRIGFLTAWNTWLSFIIQISQVALITTTYITYAAGPRAVWVAQNKTLILAASVGLIAALMWVARLGLSVGKWLSNAGSVLTMLALVALVVLPFVLAWHGKLPSYHPLPLVMPPLTLFTLTVFGRMTFGALSGFEYVAIFAGECRDPGRHLARSVLMAAPVIALLYILGTSAVLTFISPDAVDIIGPVPQALSLGFQSFGVIGIIAPIAILLVLANYLCSYSVYVSGMARLPMVAGWDHLVPEWFGRLHPTYRTPVNSILAVGGVALVSGAAVLAGVGVQEAFVQLQTWIWGLYSLPYLVMFAIPVLAGKRLGIRPAWWLRAASVSGFLVVLLFLLLAVFPIVSVESNGEYTIKTVGVVVGVNILGGVLYWLGHQKGAATQP